MCMRAENTQILIDLRRESDLRPFINAANFDRQLAEDTAEQEVKTGRLVNGFMLVEIDPALLMYDLAYQEARNGTVNIKKLAEHYVPEAFAPIVVNYRDGVFVVTDGFHRVSYFLMNGITTITALVTLNDDLTGKTFEEEAKRFSNQNSGTKEMTQHDTFDANLIHGDPVDTSIARVCAARHIAVSRSTSDLPDTDGVLTALAAARDIVKHVGEEGFAWCVDTIKEVGWLEQPNGLCTYILNGFYRVYRDGCRVEDLGTYHDNVVHGLNFTGIKDIATQLHEAWPSFADIRKAMPLLIQCIGDGRITIDPHSNMPLVRQIMGYSDIAEEQATKGKKSDKTQDDPKDKDKTDKKTDKKSVKVKPVAKKTKK